MASASTRSSSGDVTPGAFGRLGQSAVNSVVTGGEPTAEVGGLVPRASRCARGGTRSAGPGWPRAPGGDGDASGRCGVRARPGCRRPERCGAPARSRRPTTVAAGGTRRRRPTSRSARRGSSSTTCTRLGPTRGRPLLGDRRRGRSARAAGRGVPRQRATPTTGRTPAPSDRAVQTWTSIAARSVPVTTTIARRPPGGRPSATRASRSDVGDVAGLRGGGSAGGASRGVRASSGSPAATTSSAIRAVATRTSSSAGRQLGSTGGGPNADSGSTPTSPRSGRPRPGALAPSTRSASSGDGSCRSLSRRSSSSCWAPGR